MRKSLYVSYLALALLVLFAGCAYSQQGDQKAKGKTMKTEPKFEIIKTEAEWRKALSPEEYYILREKGTERAGTGKFNVIKKQGVFLCGACGNELFTSNTKYNSGSGWPSFYEPIKKEAIHEETDRSYGMVRTEVMCGRCGGHLGHVFPDGPRPTGLRYCINSAALDFKDKDSGKVIDGAKE